MEGVQGVLCDQAAFPEWSLSGCTAQIGGVGIANYFRSVVHNTWESCFVFDGDVVVEPGRGIESENWFNGGAVNREHPCWPEKFWVFWAGEYVVLLFLYVVSVCCENTRSMSRYLNTCTCSTGWAWMLSGWNRGGAFKLSLILGQIGGAGRELGH